MKELQIKISDYNYPLPDERIAKFPLPVRDSSKLLVYQQGNVSHDTFCNIGDYIPKGSLMVFNNTRVIHARLNFHRSSGAKIEVFLLEPYSPQDYEQIFQTRSHCEWLCMIGNLKKWKGETLILPIETNGQHIILKATRHEAIGTSHRVSFQWEPVSNKSLDISAESTNLSFAEMLETAGELPIPPYLNRDTQQSDLTTYQTVYSKIKGSVAAPTAGLHFTDRVLDGLRQKGIETAEITLHVGAGTFKPVKSEEIGGHDMHEEHFTVSRKFIERLIAHSGEAVAVGTTSVRTLESLYHIGKKLYHIQHNETIKDNETPINASSDPLFVEQWEPYTLSPLDQAQSGSINQATLNTQPSPLEALQAILKEMEINHIETLNACTRIIIVPGYEFKIVKRLITNFHQPKSTLLLLVSAFVKGDWLKIYNYALSNEFRFLSYGDSSILIP